MSDQLTQLAERWERDATIFSRGDGHKTRAYYLTQCAHELRQALATQPTHDDGWKPCSEPPSDDRDVLIAFTKHSSIMAVGYYSDGWIHNCYQPPTHWRELPPPLTTNSASISSKLVATPVQVAEPVANLPVNASFTIKQSEWQALSPEGREAIAEMANAVHKAAQEGKIIVGSGQYQPDPPVPDRTGGSSPPTGATEWKVRLWDEINAYAIHVGGRPDKFIYSNWGRQKAVVAVEKVVTDALREWQDNAAGWELQCIGLQEDVRRLEAKLASATPPPAAEPVCPTCGHSKTFDLCSDTFHTSGLVTLQEVEAATAPAPATGAIIDDQCTVCGVGYYLPSDVCDHCNVHRKDAGYNDHLKPTHTPPTPSEGATLGQDIAQFSDPKDAARYYGQKSDAVIKQLTAANDLLRRVLEVFDLTKSYTDLFPHEFELIAALKTEIAALLPEPAARREAGR